MFDPLLILFVLTIVVHDGVHGLPAGEVFSVAITVSVVLGGIVAIVGGAYGFTAIRLHQYDRAPTQKYARSVLRIQSIAKLLLAAHWLVVVLWLGWLQETREYLGGNLVLIDEGLAVAPFLVGLMVLYGVPHGLRQRYREAMLTRMLDQGEPIPPQIGLLHAIWETARLKMGTVLVPVIVLITASESIDRLIVRLRLRRPQWGEGDWPEIVGGGAQFAAVISVLICMPLALRWIWRTSRLPAGEVRDRLVRMCREQSVRVRDILVWHTDHATLNGAMVGVLPRVRYIMLTDALIERLPTEQLEAVMAHEIAHAKHHHLPWMIAAVGSVVAICSSGLWLAARPILMRMDDHRQFVHWSDITSLAVLVVALAVAILFFGYMSRR